MGLTLGLSKVLFNGDGKVSVDEIAKHLSIVGGIGGALAGAIIGFVVGGPGGAAIGAVVGLGLTLAVGKIVTEWANATFTIDGKGLGEKLKEVAAKIIEGFVEGFNRKWQETKDWALSLFQGIVDGVRNIFGIHSPSTVFAEIGENIIEGLVGGLREKWEDFKTWFDEKKQKFEEFKQNLKDDVGELKNHITSKITDTVTSASQKVGEIGRAHV